MIRHRPRNARVPLAACCQCLLAAVLLIAGCDKMEDNGRLKPLEKSAFFPDGRSSRELPEGVVPRSQAIAHVISPATPLPKPATEVPFEVTRQVLERGRERYDIYCAVCHNATGDGNGMIVRRGFTQPPSFHIDRLRQAPDLHYYNAMTNGFGAMYSYSDRIVPDDRWAITAYIRVLQLSQAAEVAKLPAEDQEKIKHAETAPTTKPAATPAAHH
jgi:mono/diheme cytochrome c family protein